MSPFHVPFRQFDSGAHGQPLVLLLPGMRRAGGGAGEYAIVVDQEVDGVGDGGDVELLPLVASVAGSLDGVSFHEHTTLSEDDEPSSEQGEFGTQDDDGAQTDEEQENAVDGSGFRDPSTYTIEEKRFVAATNGIRSTYSLFLAYLVPSAVVLVLGIVVDWNEPCESPMMLWACTQVVLQVLCGIVKLLSLWYLGRFARLPEDFNVTAARSQPAFKLMNLSNSALHLAWVCWLAAGTVWTAEVIFGVSSCQAESLVRISIILWAVQAFVVVMFLLFCLLACCGAAIYVGLYYRSLVVHARHAGASTDVIERCTTTSLFSVGFADEDSCSCPICLEGYEEGEKLRILGCSELHHFHASCVDQWLKKNKTCPLCKRPIDADEAAEDVSDSESNAGEETVLLAGSEVDENRAALESEV